MMNFPIVNVDENSVTLLDANGKEVSIEIELTPYKHYITQRCKRAILATGCMNHFGEWALTDKHLHEGFIRAIHEEILKCIERGRVQDQPVKHNGGIHHV